MLAHWRDGGCNNGAFTWAVPRFSRLRAKGQTSVLSPVFSAEGRRWQLQLFPNGQGGRPASLVLFLRSWDLACSTARRNDTFATEFNLGLLCQARISPCWGARVAVLWFSCHANRCSISSTSLCCVCRTRESGGCVSCASCSPRTMGLGARPWQSCRVSAPAVAVFHGVPLVLMWWFGCDGWGASIDTIISGQPRLSLHMACCRAPPPPRLRQEQHGRLAGAHHLRWPAGLAGGFYQPTGLGLRNEAAGGHTVRLLHVGCTLSAICCV